METLTLVKKIRKEQKDSKGLIIQEERSYFDFVVSGESLRTKLNADGQDLISPFGWGDEKYERELIKEFTGIKTPEIPSERLMIYVCSECGDIGCGCISVDIEVTDDKVIWRNFGYENNDPEIDLRNYNHVPFIEFNKTDYIAVFKDFAR